MPRKKTTTPEDTHTDPQEHWPAIMDRTYHPDIAHAIQAVPFTPPPLTHNSTQEALLEANAEVVHTVGCQLYEHLRRPHQQTSSVYMLINSARNFLSMREKFLRLNPDDLQSATPVKQKFNSLG